MRKGIVFACAVFLSFGSVHVLAAEKLHSNQVQQGIANATVKPGGKRPVEPVSNPPTSVMPLSILDCAKLGGKIGTMSVCESKVACRTKDQYGNTHFVCVTSFISD